MWVEGEVAEPLLTAVRTGNRPVRVAAYPRPSSPVLYVPLDAPSSPTSAPCTSGLTSPIRRGTCCAEMFADDVTLVTQVATEARGAARRRPHRRAEQFVFVENGDTYVRQSLVLGLRDDRYVEVREGLFPGDRIVVRGGYALNAARLAGAQPGEEA